MINHAHVADATVPQTPAKLLQTAALLGVAAPGSVRVPTDQPLGTLAMLLLEPEAADSLFRWGFFLEILQRTEYAEAYAIEPLAELMLQDDLELTLAFREHLAEDPEFARDPAARLDWFYRRSPWYDARHALYPVAREVGTATSATGG